MAVGGPVLIRAERRVAVVYAYSGYDLRLVTVVATGIHMSAPSFIRMGGKHMAYAPVT